MTAPSTWNTSFVYREITGQNDVQGILDLIDDAIHGTLPTGDNLPVEDQWSAFDGTLSMYKTPAQDPLGANRFIGINPFRVSATRMAWHMKDKSGTIFGDGRCDFTTTYTGRVYAGPYHLIAEMEYGAGVIEEFVLIMADPTPFPLASSPIYSCGKARRNSAGTLLTNWHVDAAAANDDNTGNFLTRRNTLWFGGTNGLAAGRTISGAAVAIPIEFNVTISGINRNVGKLYQVVTLPQDTVTGSSVDLMLDTGTTGTFRCLSHVTAGQSIAGKWGVRVA